MIDTPAASGAHGYKKAAPPEPPAASLALAPTAAATAPEDGRKGALMDGLTNGQGRADKSGALGQMNDDSSEDNGEKQKPDDARRARAPAAQAANAPAAGNAGAIGGASNYGGGGGAGVAPPAAPPPAPQAAPKPIVADRADPWASAQSTLAQPVAKDASKKEADASDLERARGAYANKNFADAAQQFDRIAANGGDPSAALWAARSVRDGNGCGAAIQRFDLVAGRQAASAIGNDALLEGGQCYRQLGQFEAARARLVRLLTVPSHAVRAQRELDAMNPKSATKPQPRKAPEPSPQAAPRKDSAF
jgi:hypothetical protein